MGLRAFIHFLLVLQIQLFFLKKRTKSVSSGSKPSISVILPHLREAVDGVHVSDMKPIFFEI